MVSLQKIDDSAVKFVFTDSDHYLYGNGEVVIPVNSLSLVIDESEMVTFKKSATGDPFISFRADNSNLGTKEAIEQFYKENMVGAGGISEEEVQDMIDAATSGMPSSQVVEQLRTDLNTVSGDVSNLQGETQGIWDTIDEKEEVIASALTQLNQDVADIDAKEEVIASALTEVNQALNNKLDASAYTPTDLSEYWTSGQTQNAINAATSGIPSSQVIEALRSDLNTVSGDVENKQDALVFYSENEYDEEMGEEATAVIQVSSPEYPDYAGVNVQPYTATLYASSEGEEPMSTNLTVEATGVTINDERVLTESDGVYYINFATLTTQGIHDADWDAMVAAINAHRPIYAGLGNEYYVSECLVQSGNQIILTASNHLAHFIYTFTKNGSENYSFSSETRPYTTQAEKTAWNAKVDTSAITTSVTSGSTDSEIPTAKAVYDAIPTGGGATYSAGTNISIDTANTINCTLNLQNGSATGQGSIVIAPYGTTASGNRALAGGMLASAGGEESIAYGAHAKTNSNAGSSFALGSYVETKNQNETSLGYYNKTNKKNYTFGDSGNTLFSVGNGTEENARHNAFEIRQNGDIYVNDGTNDVKLQDTITATTANTTALGGLKLVKLSQSEYSAMEQAGTLDSNTLYIVTNVVS